MLIEEHQALRKVLLSQKHHLVEVKLPTDDEMPGAHDEELPTEVFLEFFIGHKFLEADPPVAEKEPGVHVLHVPHVLRLVADGNRKETIHFVFECPFIKRLVLEFQQVVIEINLRQL